MQTIATTWIICAWRLVVAFAFGVGTGVPSHGAPRTINGFDVSNATIPVRRIISGGVPRDRIPSLTLPTRKSFADLEAVREAEGGGADPARAQLLAAGETAVRFHRRTT